MPSIGLWMVALAIGLLALPVGWPRRDRRNGLRVTIGLAILLAAAAVALCGLMLESYRWPRDDVPVAGLSLRQTGPETFVATLRPVDRAGSVIELEGDEWRLDVRVMRGKTTGHFGGPRTMVRLESLWAGFHDARSLPALLDLHGLDDESLEFPPLHERLGARLPVFDVRRESTGFVPMRDGANYDVFLDPRGGPARVVVIPAAQVRTVTTPPPATPFWLLCLMVWVAVVTTVGLVEGLRSGRILGRYGMVERDRNPAEYWFYICNWSLVSLPMLAITPFVIEQWIDWGPWF